jgi:cbb3-type cytochrome oxidase subunit 1
MSAAVERLPRLRARTSTDRADGEGPAPVVNPSPGRPLPASGNLTGLNVHAPSILLPLRFMITGLLALCASVVLLLVRPEMLATYHYNQYVIAVTHLFVLGWICTIVMGAMYQLVPVALETKLYSERLARWQFVLHLLGFSGMVWMFWTWNMKQVGHFGSVLVLGVSLFVYNIFRTLLRVPRWNHIATAVVSALAWLLVAVFAGLTIAAGKSSFDSSSPLTSGGVVAALIHGVQTLAGVATRFDAISAMHAHAHLGVIGVFIMLIVGLSYKLVPMFALSEVQNSRRALASIVLLNTGLLASFLAILMRSRFKPLCALLVICALVLYGLELKAILHARKRRNLDWGVKYFLTSIALLGLLSLLGLVLSWPTLPLTIFTGQLENLYGFLAIVGVISFAIIGMLYKIFPFLVWYRSYSRRIGLQKVPALSDLYSPRLQAAGYYSFVAGLGMVSLAIVLSNAALARWGTALLVASLGVFAINVLKMLRHLISPQTQPLNTQPLAKGLASGSIAQP